MIHRGEVLKHIGHPGPYCNHRPRTFPAVRGLLFLALAYSALFTSSPINAEVGELKVQEPWAYTYRSDQENNIEFMAITPAAEDGKIWLVRSNQLLASTSDMNGETHMYSFSLQPNNRALRDIDIHCALE